MVNVAITGGSGFIAQHLIKKFQENSSGFVDSILTIDKKPKSEKYLDYPEIIPVRHLQLDVVETEALEKALSGIDVVFHFARKRLEFLFDAENEAEFSELYVRDNITATESLLSAMISSNVQYLVFLGDAYANLEIEDNFGLSEDNYPGIPKTFITGEAGETRIRSELIARSFVGKKLKNGKDLRATFPRPVFVYGEGDRKFPLALKAVAKRNNGSVPVFEGSSRGMFQYIYAGNLAGMLESTMKTLMENPERCNGDYFYCIVFAGNMSLIWNDLVDEISQHQKSRHWDVLLRLMLSGKEPLRTIFDIFSNIRIIMLANDDINFWFYGFPSRMIKITKFVPRNLIKHAIFRTDKLYIHFATPGTNADKLLKMAANGNNFKRIKFVEPDIFVCDRLTFFNVVKRASPYIEFDGDWSICNRIHRRIHVAKVHFDKPLIEISRFFAKQEMEITELHLASNGMTDSYRLGDVNKVFNKVNPRDDVKKLVFHISPTKFWPNFEPERLLDDIAKIFRELNYLRLDIESDIPYFMIQKYATMFLGFNRCLKRDDFRFSIEISIKMRTQVPEPQYDVDVLRELLNFLVVDNLNLKETEDDIQARYYMDNAKTPAKRLEFLLVFDHVQP